VERKNYTGKNNSLNGLYYDSKKNCLIFPNGLSEQEKSYISNDFSNPRNNILSYNIHYNQKWLNNIIKYYKNSDTLIILAKIPCVPLHTGKQNLKFGESSSLLDIAKTNKNKVIIIQDNLFDYLEDPQYFADHIHFNFLGRELFSKHLSSVIIDYLTPIGGK
jgi:hypothetical protein